MRFTMMLLALTCSASHADDFWPALPMPSKGLDEQTTLTRIALGSCFDQRRSDKIFAKIQEAKPDAFLFIGDNVYASDESDDPQLMSLKRAYRQLANSDRFALLREAIPVLPIWDDHDYGLNDAGGDWPRRRIAESLFEHVWDVAPEDPRSQREGIYFARNIGPEGRRVQLIFLDTRFFRTPLTKNSQDQTAPYEPSEDAHQDMLGDEQWQWLESKLLEPAELRIIVSSIMVLSDIHGFESWRMLPRERQRFYKLLDTTAAGGVLIVSGDTHAGAMYRSDETIDYPLIELNTSSMNVPLTSFVENPKQVPGVHRVGDIYFEANFGLINIDWDSGQVTLQMRNENNQTVREQSIYISALN